MLSTLYAALYMKSYVLSLVCSGLQVSVPMPPPPICVPLLAPCTMPPRAPALRTHKRELPHAARTHRVPPPRLVQVVALLYYLMSYFPGGTQGVRFMLGLLYSAVWGCFSSAKKLLLK